MILDTCVDGNKNNGNKELVGLLDYFLLVLFNHCSFGDSVFGGLAFYCVLLCEKKRE